MHFHFSRDFCGGLGDFGWSRWLLKERAEGHQERAVEGRSDERTDDDGSASDTSSEGADDTEAGAVDGEPHGGTDDDGSASDTSSSDDPQDFIDATDFDDDLAGDLASRPMSVPPEPMSLPPDSISLPTEHLQLAHATRATTNPNDGLNDEPSDEVPTQSVMRAVNPPSDIPGGDGAATTRPNPVPPGGGSFPLDENDELYSAELRARLTAAFGSQLEADLFIDSLRHNEKIIMDYLAQCEEAAERDGRDPSKSAEYVFCRVLGDIFHAMRRVPVSMDCAIKALYFRCLSAAFFIDDKSDLERAKQVAKNIWPNSSREDIVDYKRAWVRARVRRYVPTPDVLEGRVSHVIDFFARTSEQLGLRLFLKGWEGKRDELLREIKQGCYSDPIDEPMYVQQQNDDGTPKFDKHGLPLWRSIRGTNITEMVHSLYSKARSLFKGAGSELCLIALRIIAHHHNHNMLSNRPGGKHSAHSDTWLTATTNHPTRKVEGKERYPQCPCAVALRPTRLCTISPVSEDAVLNADRLIHGDNRKLLLGSLSDDMKFVAALQGLAVPCYAFRHRKETELYKKILRDELREMDENEDLTIAAGRITEMFNKAVAEKYLEKIRGLSTPNNTVDQSEGGRTTGTKQLWLSLCFKLKSHVELFIKAHRNKGIRKDYIDELQKNGTDAFRHILSRHTLGTRSLLQAQSISSSSVPSSMPQSNPPQPSVVNDDEDVIMANNETMIPTQSTCQITGVRLSGVSRAPSSPRFIPSQSWSKR